MNYMGGKHRQGSMIAEFVRRVLKPGQDYYEPFCGALGAASRVAGVLPGNNRMVLSDVNEALITTWQALLDGWIPPDVVDEETYDHYKKNRDPKDPMTAYVGFGMSFGSKWFGGYARNERGSAHYAVNLKRSSLLKAASLLKARVSFSCRSYETVTPVGAVVYLDPPYANRTKAHGVTFDSDKFWTYARNLSETNHVLITEFVAPDDFVAVHSWGDTVVRHHSGKAPDGTAERIFVHESRLK